MEVWQKIVEKLKNNHKVILLLVVSHDGSSPGKQGFKMMVADDDYLFGSIGGGRTEFRLAEKAKTMLKEGLEEVFLQNQVHRDETEDSSGMICAGEQLVAFYPLNKGHITTVSQLIKDNKGMLTITNQNIFFDAKAKPKTDFAFLQLPDKSWEYREKVNRKSYVYLVGGGHVGLATAKLFQMLDFEVTMFDDRKNLNTFEENTYSDYKYIIDYQNITDYIKEGDNTYIVILTHGYQADKLIFGKLAQKNYKYIGLLGSKAKINAMFKTMIAEGCDKKKLLKADAPIGIAINSKTPEEIAVSIAAKIIAVRNG
jgi:xanthine dehydrogenase accessory factor